MKKVLKAVRNFFRSSLGMPEKVEKFEPVIIPRDKHIISRRDIDPDALKVLYRLRKFQHTAYLVGGGVRDLLLGIKAKDFDIATSAHPGQIKKTFNNCRLVGRRFRLAHILFRGKFIEVATFRKLSEFDIDDEGSDREDLLIRSDNTFGTPEDDAFRRDFTINALFYHIDDFSVIDYVDGLKDLKAKVIRSIGDPNIRFREDPLRMLRAIRLAARLGFEIEPETLAALNTHRGEILKGAQPRILEELHRMLKEGHARRAMTLLKETGLMTILLPELEHVITRRGQATSFWKCIDALDRLVAQGHEFSFPVLYGLLMLHVFRSRTENTTGTVIIADLVEETFLASAKLLEVPKRSVDRTKAILLAQRRFPEISKSGFRPGTFLSRPYYHEALDLFGIQAHAFTEQLPLLKRWAALDAPPPRHEVAEFRRGRPDRGQPRDTLLELGGHEADDESRHEAKAGQHPADAKAPAKKRSRRRRGSGRSGRAAGTESSAPIAEAAPELPFGDAAPAKEGGQGEPKRRSRRGGRRRRKPAGTTESPPTTT